MSNRTTERPALSRRPLSIRAKYDAARTTEDNRKHWQMADDLSADAANSPEVRRILRSRARYEAANNGYCCGMVRTLAVDVVGCGPRLQMLTGNAVLDKAVERHWRRWAKAARLARKLRTARRCKAVDGESFLLVVRNRLLFPVQMDLRIIEPEMVATPAGLSSPTSVDGLVLDSDGNVVGYHVLHGHPGGADALKSTTASTWDADRVIHLYDEVRAGQHRGVPEIMSSLGLFAHARRYTLAVVTAAEGAALHAMVVESESPPNGSDDEFGLLPMDTIELERGMATTLPAGARLNQVKAEQPTTTYPQFKREMLSEAGRPLCMPYNVAAADSSNHNFSSGKLDRLGYLAAVGVDREEWETECLDRLLHAWLAEAVLAIPDLRAIASVIEVEGEVPHEWHWDAPEPIDEVKASKAREARLRSGMTSLSTEFAADGRVAEVEMTTMASDLGLTLEQYRQVLVRSLYPDNARVTDAEALEPGE